MKYRLVIPDNPHKSLHAALHRLIGFDGKECHDDNGIHYFFKSVAISKTSIPSEWLEELEEPMSLDGWMDKLDEDMPDRLTSYDKKNFTLRDIEDTWYAAIENDKIRRESDTVEWAESVGWSECVFSGGPPEGYESWNDFVGSKIKRHVYIRSATKEDYAPANGHAETKEPMSFGKWMQDRHGADYFGKSYPAHELGRCWNAALKNDKLRQENES